jgi:hypothetical protein
VQSVADIENHEERYQPHEAMSFAAWRALNILSTGDSVRAKDLHIEQKVLNTLLSRLLIEEASTDLYRLTKRGRALVADKMPFDPRIKVTRELLEELELLSAAYSTDAGETRWRKTLEEMVLMASTNGNGHSEKVIGAMDADFDKAVAGVLKDRNKDVVELNIPGMSIHISIDSAAFKDWQDYRFRQFFAALGDTVRLAAQRKNSF